MQIRTKFDGLAEFTAILAEAQERISDLTPLYRAIAPIMEQASEEAFAGERSPAGQAWAQLSARTANRLVTKGRLNKKTGKRSGGIRRGAHPILQVTGRLAQLTTEFDSTGVRHGSNLIYAARQQLGGGGIPAREFLGLGPQHFNAIEDQIDAFIWPQRGLFA